MPRVNMPFFGAIMYFKFNTQEFLLANLTLILKQTFVKFSKSFL